MKYTLLLIISAFSLIPGFAIQYKGKIIDWKTNTPVAGCKVFSNCGKDTLITGEDGSFAFEAHDSLNKHYIYVGILKEGYLYKTFSYSVLLKKKKEILKIRKNNDFLMKECFIDSTLIGKQLSWICKKYKLDIHDFKTYFEPKGKARGIYFTTGDGSILNFFIDVIIIGREGHRKVLSQRVTGFYYSNKDCSKQLYYGKGCPIIGPVQNHCPDK